MGQVHLPNCQRRSFLKQVQAMQFRWLEHSEREEYKPLSGAIPYFEGAVRCN